MECLEDGLDYFEGILYSLDDFVKWFIVLVELVEVIVDWIDYIVSFGEMVMLLLLVIEYVVCGVLDWF